MNYECKRFDKLDFIKMKNSTLGKSLLKKNEKMGKESLISKGICTWKM